MDAPLDREVAPRARQIPQRRPVSPARQPDVPVAYQQFPNYEFRSSPPSNQEGLLIPARLHRPTEFQQAVDRSVEERIARHSEARNKPRPAPHNKRETGAAASSPQKTLYKPSQPADVEDDESAVTDTIGGNAGEPASPISERRQTSPRKLDNVNSRRGTSRKSNKNGQMSSGEDEDA